MAADDDEIPTDEPSRRRGARDEEDADLEVEPDAEELDDEEDVVVGRSTRTTTTRSSPTTTRRTRTTRPTRRPPTRTKRRAGEEEEDDDEDLLSPDDVEADLDRILKDRLVTAEDEDEDEEDEPDDRSRRRRPAAAQAGRRAAVPELLPARAGHRARAVRSATTTARSSADRGHDRRRPTIRSAPRSSAVLHAVVGDGRRRCRSPARAAVVQRCVGASSRPAAPAAGRAVRPASRSLFDLVAAAAPPASVDRRPSSRRRRAGRRRASVAVRAPPTRPPTSCRSRSTRASPPARSSPGCRR